MAFEQHNRNKFESSVPTASGGQSSLSSAKVSPEIPSMDKKSKSGFRSSSKNEGFIKISSPQKATKNSQSIREKSGKIGEPPSLKIHEIIDSLKEIEKGLD